MSKLLVYLAGPISGCDYLECTDWRAYVAEALDSAEVKCLSPMRNKEMLAEEEYMNPLGYDHPLTTQRGVQTRDHNDCIRSDLLFVNLLGAERVSIGTVMELAWAWEKRIPIVCLMEKDNCHQHIMLKESMDFTLEDVDSGIKIAKAVLAVE